MSNVIDLKIPLQRRFWGGYHNYSLGPRPRPITASLPIYVSRYGRYAHRVRSGVFHWQVWQGHWDGKTRGKEVNQGRISVSLWCGQNGLPGWKGKLHAVPPDGYPLCGTCEGRAVGAGYPGIAILQQRYELIYTPREGRVTMPASEVASS